MLRIWDKKESINGKSAEDYLNNNPLIHDGDEIVFECDDLGRPTLVINATTERSNLKLDSSIDAITVAETYLASMESQNNSTSTTPTDNSVTTSTIAVALKSVEPTVSVVKALYDMKEITNTDVYNYVVNGNITTSDYKTITSEDCPELPLDTMKQNKINELNNSMEDFIINNFYSSCLGTSKKFDCEQTDQIDIQGLAIKSQMILAGQQLSDTTTNWKESGVDVCYHFEPAQCVQLGVDLSVHLTEAKEKKEKLVVYVKSLTDKTTIESVNWDTQIPTTTTTTTA